jgi:hypothetical protein
MIAVLRRKLGFLSSVANQKTLFAIVTFLVWGTNFALATIGDLATWPTHSIAIEAVPVEIKAQLTGPEALHFDGSVRLFHTSTPIGDISLYQFNSAATCDGDRCLCVIHLSANEENPTARPTNIVVRSWKLIERLPMLAHAERSRDAAIVLFDETDAIFGVRLSYDGTVTIERAIKTGH